MGKSASARAGSVACTRAPWWASLLGTACLLAPGTSPATGAPPRMPSEPPMQVRAADRPAFAPDQYFVQAGRARETTTFTVGLQWDWQRSWQIGENTLLTGYNEVSLGHWRADAGGGDAIVTQIGLTPVLRFWPSGTDQGWFYEGAIGVNVLTPVYRTREKNFSTAFNFGDHIAVGHRSGGGRRIEWSLRLQHYSNAGIQQPNPGENFVQLRVTVPI